MVFIWFFLYLGRVDAAYYFIIFKIYFMYHLFCFTPSCQVWVCAANGWHIYVSHGVVIGRIRYPAPGSRRWLALLP